MRSCFRTVYHHVEAILNRYMDRHVKVCVIFTHTQTHVGKLDQTKWWVTAIRWDEEEARQHEECLGGIRRHFWFGMVSKMYVMSVSSNMEGGGSSPHQCLYTIPAIKLSTAAQVVLLLAAASTGDLESYLDRGYGNQCLSKQTACLQHAHKQTGSGFRCVLSVLFHH